MKYSWNKYTLMDRLDYLERLKKNKPQEIIDEIDRNINVGSEYDYLYTTLLTTLNDAVIMNDKYLLSELLNTYQPKTNKRLKALGLNELNMDSEDVEFLADYDSEYNMTYIISLIYAIELYELYKIDKEKSLYILKKFIRLPNLSSKNYLIELKKLGLKPNLHIQEYKNYLEDKILSRKLTQQ